MITLENILARIPAIVGKPVDPRWTRASLTLRGSDRVCRESFFNATTYEERLKLVTDRFSSGSPWSPLLQKDIPKAGKAGTRPICWPTCVDAALGYALVDVLGPSIEEKLSNIAVAYRPGRRMTDSIISAVSKARSRKLNVVCVTDISDFYGSILWGHLDKVIDELPADLDVKELLRALVRVEVRRVEDGAIVQRDRGIPQGLAISPMLANLAMVEFDKNVAATSGRQGSVVRRYADDILTLSPSVDAGEHARRIVGGQLGMLGLSVKKGTGEVVDLAVEGTSATWLGVQLSGHMTHNSKTLIKMDIPEGTVAAKAGELQRELEAGLTTGEDIENRLAHLGRYWTGLVPPHKARLAIKSIRDCIANKEEMTPVQVLKNSISEIPSVMSNKKEEVLKNKEKSIEEMIHPYSRTSRTTRDEDGKRETGRVTMVVGRKVGIDRWKMKKPLSAKCPSALPRHEDRRGENDRKEKEDRDLYSPSTPMASKDGKDLSTPVWVDGSLPISPAGGSYSSEGASAVITRRGLELCPPDRPRVSEGRDGMPAVLHPIRLRKRVVVRAEAWGSKTVVVSVEVDGARGPWRRLKVHESTSTAEVVLAGFEDALRTLDIGDADIQLVTTEPTICGYLERGWRVGSFAVLRRLRDLQRLLGDPLPMSPAGP